MMSILQGGFSLFSTSFLTADPMNMAFEITVGQQVCQHELLKGRDCAGIKAQTVPEFFHQMDGKHHIGHTQGRGDGFGKAVQVYHIVTTAMRKYRLPGFAG